MNTVLSFPGVSSKDYGENIALLTRSRKDDPSTGFLRDLAVRNISAVNFDSVKDDLDRLRDSTGENSQKLKSVDAFFRSSSGKFFFIEFKKSTAEALTDIDEGESIAVSLRKKAFDSITLSGITATQDITGSELMQNAVLIVVYKSSAADSIGAIEIGDSLTRLASGSGTNGRQPPKWGLDELRSNGLYSEVYTWPDNKFESWAPTNLR